jgi:DNA-binding CsgD family transcriptional regulator
MSTNKQIEFSKDELKVIKLICRQLTSQEIAEKLKLTSRI